LESASMQFSQNWAYATYSDAGVYVYLNMGDDAYSSFIVTTSLRCGSSTRRVKWLKTLS